MSAVKDARGLCYSQAGRYLLKCGRSGILFHGRIFGGHPRRWINHAWVDLGDQVYCPHMGLLDSSLFYGLFDPQIESAYSSEEVAVNTLRFKHWGPWD